MKRNVWTMVAVMLIAGQAFGKPRARRGDPPPQPVPDRLVTIRVILPAEDAKVWIDNTETKQKGTERTYVTPPLAKGIYSSTVKTSWFDKETHMTAVRTVTFQPGQEVIINFTIRTTIHPVRVPGKAPKQDDKK